MHRLPLAEGSEHHSRMSKIAAASAAAKKFSERAAASVKREAEQRAKLKAIERKQAAVLAAEREAAKLAEARAQKLAKAEATTVLQAKVREGVDEQSSLTFAALSQEGLSPLVSRLHALVQQSRGLHAHECERLATGAYEAAKRKLASLEKNRALVAEWLCECGASPSSSLASGDEDGGQAAPVASTAAATITTTTTTTTGADKLRGLVAAVKGDAQRRRPATAGPAGPAMLVRLRPRSGGIAPAGGSYGRLLHSDLATLSKRLGGKQQLLDGVLESLPPALPLPRSTAAEMKASLRLVMHALTHNLRLEAADGELAAALAAFKSWHSTSWLDPRGGSVVKPKEPYGWTVEQYGLCGFAPLYAGKLHVPRIAAARQVVTWMLQCAPGLPTDAPIGFGDLGAGTCAACVGARMAVREHAGHEQPYRVFPIEVASAGARFARAFSAMTRSGPGGGAPVLPGQQPSQYLTEEMPGLLAGAASLFKQVAARGEAPPQVLIASFCLQYLRSADGERDAFYAGLRTLSPSPYLLLVIKGVGEAQRPPPSALPTVFLGIHYVIGEDRNPRVVEAHLCLVMPQPSGGEEEEEESQKEEEEEEEQQQQGADGAWSWSQQQNGGSATAAGTLPALRVPSGEWARATFRRATRRCASGPLKGVTLFEESIVESAAIDQLFR